MHLTQVISFSFSCFLSLFHPSSSLHQVSAMREESMKLRTMWFHKFKNGELPAQPSAGQPNAGVSNAAQASALQQHSTSAPLPPTPSALSSANLNLNNKADISNGYAAAVVSNGNSMDTKPNHNIAYGGAHSTVKSNGVATTSYANTSHPPPSYHSSMMAAGVLKSEPSLAEFAPALSGLNLAAEGFADLTGYDGSSGDIGGY